MNDITKAAILAKNLNHIWGPDGFCTLCHNVHRTDLRQNNLCPQLMKGVNPVDKNACKTWAPKADDLQEGFEPQ
jgi:hypothetical protein